MPDVVRMMRSCRLACATMLALALCPPAAWGQVAFTVQGVADVEGWTTDSASALLARNDGRPGVVGRMVLWSAVEPWPNVVLFGEAQGETGSARREAGSEVYVEQYGARWSPADAFVLQVGKMPHVVGAFSARHLSFRNPLVDSPDGYSLVYPIGARISGVVSMFDYRAAILSKPLTHEDYSPDPSNAPRPAVGMGITPFTGFRLGGSATVGPYLNRGLAPSLLAGRDWTHYLQRIIAADVQWSRGYFESYAELASSSYDVPGRTDPIAGLTWYAESKYTFTPRLYLAVRVEHNDYPFISPRGTDRWIASPSVFSDVEAGAGYRLTSATLLKLSVRADRWNPNANPAAPQANGHAIAGQISRTFDWL